MLRRTILAARNVIYSRVSQNRLNIRNAIGDFKKLTPSPKPVIYVLGSTGVVSGYVICKYMESKKELKAQLEEILKNKPLHAALENMDVDLQINSINLIGSEINKYILNFDDFNRVLNVVEKDLRYKIISQFSDADLRKMISTLTQLNIILKLLSKDEKKEIILKLSDTSKTYLDNLLFENGDNDYRSNVKISDFLSAIDRDVEEIIIKRCSRSSFQKNIKKISDLPVLLSNESLLEKIGYDHLIKLIKNVDDFEETYSKLCYEKSKSTFINKYDSYHLQKIFFCDCDDLRTFNRNVDRMLNLLDYHCSKENRKHFLEKIGSNHIKKVLDYCKQYAVLYNDDNYEQRARRLIDFLTTEMLMNILAKDQYVGKSSPKPF